MKHFKATHLPTGITGEASLAIHGFAVDELLGVLTDTYGKRMIIHTAEDSTFVKALHEMDILPIVGGKEVVVIQHAERIREPEKLLFCIQNQQLPPFILLSVIPFRRTKAMRSFNVNLIEFLYLPKAWTATLKTEGYLMAMNKLEEIILFGQMVNSSKLLFSDFGINLVDNMLNVIAEQHSIRKPAALRNLAIALAISFTEEISLSKLGRMCRLDKKTVSTYLNLFESSGMIFSLHPLTDKLQDEHGQKKQYYFTDNGIRNALINDFRPIKIRGDANAIWKNFLISERRKSYVQIPADGEMGYWRTYQGQKTDYLEKTPSGLRLFSFDLGDGKINRTSSKIMKNYTVESNRKISRKNFLGFLEETPD